MGGVDLVFVCGDRGGGRGGGVAGLQKEDGEEEPPAQ